MMRICQYSLISAGLILGLVWAGQTSAQITSLDDHFDGTAGDLLDSALWNTRDDDSGSGVVDFGGDAQPGTNGRGVVEEDGSSNVSLEGDLFPFAAWGELGFVSKDFVQRPGTGGAASDPLYLYFWNSRSDETRSKVYLGLSNRGDSVALGVIRAGYGWSIQGGQIQAAIEDVEYNGNLIGIDPDQFFPVNPNDGEGGPAPFQTNSHDFRLKITQNDTQLEYKEIYDSTWQAPDWSLFGGAPTSNTEEQLYVVVGGRVGDPDQIDHTDFLLDRVQLSNLDLTAQDGAAPPPRTILRNDTFIGTAGQPVDSALWKTRDMNTGATNGVDVGGAAMEGQNGRGLIQLDGNGQVSLESDNMSPQVFGELGMISSDAVRRPVSGEGSTYVYFWNARSDEYRSNVFLGLSPRGDSVALGVVQEGYGFHINGGSVEVALEDTLYAGSDLGIPDEFFPENPVAGEGGPSPAHDFRITLTDTETSFEYKQVGSNTWLSPDWNSVIGAKPSSDALRNLWLTIGGSVGPDPTPSPLDGDANKDGQVTGADLISVQQNFGDVGPTPLQGDANNDGQVTGADLISVQQNFGDVTVIGGSDITDFLIDQIQVSDMDLTQSGGNAPVPEPGSFALLILGSAMLLRSRRISSFV